MRLHSSICKGKNVIQVKIIQTVTGKISNIYFYGHNFVTVSYFIIANTLFYRSANISKS